MPEQSETLAQECGAARQAAVDAIAWLSDNPDYVGVAQKSLRREFMRGSLALSKLERSARRPMSVAVFGPSQAGKSYLSSALLGMEGEPMKIDFGNKEYDFLDDINPGKLMVETTGLVTRFTRQTMAPAPAGYPVYMRLLTQTDLVKILANTYFLDFDPKVEIPVRVEDVEAVLSELERSVEAKPVDPLDAVEIDDIRFYVETTFERRPTVERLKEANFWERFEEFAPRLKVEQRVRAYRFLWGGLEEFSQVYIALYNTLKRLGFAEEVYGSIDALIPKTTTILDVAQLAHLLGGEGGEVEVRGAGGPVQVARPLLTAVVAELVLKVKAAKWPFLEHTDLLDFPGARSRVMNKDPVNDVKELEKVGSEFFRRGKVAYLFDRYRAENDVTSMLLCLQPGNQEVRTLTDLVNPWIHTSLGDTPEKRARVENTLFFVFTKFDTHFKDAAGLEIGTDARWTGAIEPPLVDMFARGRDPWPTSWVPGRPFDNCYWLRNPGWPAKDIIQYEGKREVGFVDRERQGQRPLADLKSVYARNPLVQRHFRDPPAAWDAALSFNDGGIGYLAGALDPVCKPDVKLSQIRAALADRREYLHDKIEEFYVAGDAGEAEREKRRERAKGAIRDFRPVAERERFGHFLSTMQIDAMAVLLRLRQRPAAESGPVPVKSDVRWDDILDRLGLGQERSEANVDGEAPSQAKDLAGKVMEYWTERMRELPKQDRLLTHLGLDAKTAEVMVSEMLDGAVRQKLPSQIAHIIAVNRPPIDTDPEAAYRPARAACDLVNAYVVRMGYDGVRPEERPTIVDRASGRPVPIFLPPPRPERNERLVLPGPESKVRVLMEWLRGFLDLVHKNAESGNSRQANFDPAQNERLGRLLQTLSGRASDPTATR